jgi:hypothetical protein
VSGVRIVRAAGTPFEAGFRHGTERAGDIAAFIADDLCRIGKLAPAPVSLDALRPDLAAYDAAITGATPALSEEIDGLAAGAGISRELAVLLQVRREVIGYQRVPARGDCTTYASLSAGPGGQPVLAQTVDLNGDLDDQLAVLDITLCQQAGDGRGRQALVLSFGGLLGYLGLNSDGLAIGLNLVLGGQWRPGLPPYLAIRHLLDHAGSVDEALHVLAGLPLASSRSLTLCDPGVVACVEILGDELAITRSDRSAHTNHYLDAGFAARDELNVFARNSSVQRLRAAQAALAAWHGSGTGAAVDQHFGVLASQPVCVKNTGDIRRERTVAAVVLLPEAGELHLRPGDPSQSRTTSLRLCLPALSRRDGSVPL